MKTNTNTLINGLPGDQISVLDRGFQYGDGVFETIALKNGMLLYWDEHLKRLIKGCERLYIPVPDTNLLLQDAQTLCSGVDKGVIKIIISRGLGGRGYQQPDPAMPTRVVRLHSTKNYPQSNWVDGVNVIICESVLGTNKQLAGLKHLNRLEQILARNEWSDVNVAEGIMLDSHNNVIEGTSTNVFIVSDGEILTPDLENCGVEGVMRAIVMKIIASTQFSCKVSEIPLSKFLGADEVFLTNSLIGIWPVKKVDNVALSVGPISQLLWKKLQNNF